MSSAHSVIHKPPRGVQIQSSKVPIQPGLLSYQGQVRTENPTGLKPSGTGSGHPEEGKKCPWFSPYKQQKCLQQLHRLLTIKHSVVLWWYFIHLIDVTWWPKVYTPIMVFSVSTEAPFFHYKSVNWFKFTRHFLFPNADGLPLYMYIQTLLRRRKKYTNIHSLSSSGISISSVFKCRTG